MHPAWTVLACLVSLLSGMTLMYAYRRRLPQHAGAGEGSPTVWQLIDHVEAEAAQRTASTGKHHLREPREPTPVSTLDTVPIPRWPGDFNGNGLGSRP
ncbi:hypothetical protein BJ970_004152 [Saccharopolyspora phatthalungensis]|uniref:Uncharacterized protein n=1 Tax=Saccharopolyspora phatthalungensis TaxID=664693 RepID=A0A840QDA4_9PSEU|nr:hypothetical protein [Saccharopolyspora phatthalungensis]